MKNYVQDGRVLSLTAPAALASGEAFLTGAVFAVANHAAAEGAVVNATVEGVFTLPKAVVAISQGAALYWDATAKALTTDDAGNTLVASAAAAALLGDTTVAASIDRSPKTIVGA